MKVTAENGHELTIPSGPLTSASQRSLHAVGLLEVVTEAEIEIEAEAVQVEAEIEAVTEIETEKDSQQERSLVMMTSGSGRAIRDAKTEKENSWKDLPWTHLTGQVETRGMQEVDQLDSPLIPDCHCHCPYFL